jgi:hypothetical protein
MIALLPSQKEKRDYLSTINLISDYNPWIKNRLRTD